MDQAVAPDVSIFDETTSTLSPMPDRTCPLCKSDIKLFFINFNDKMLMCENTECEFPFGYEDLQFVKENNEQLCDMELDTENIKRMNTPAASAITRATSASGIERINKACLSEDSQFDFQSVDVQDFINVPPVTVKPDDSYPGKKGIQDDLTVIRECQEKLRQYKRQEKSTFIRSEETLLKLAELQKASGPSILTPLEITYLKEKGIDLAKKEDSLKIEIKKEGNNIFQIDLEILDDGE